jgi:hypothetical protein
MMLTVSPSIYVVNSTDGGSAGSGNAGTLPYVVGLANSDPNPAGSVIEFDATVFDPHTSHEIDLQATLGLGETAGPEVIEGPGAQVVTLNASRTSGAIQVFSGVTAKVSGLTIAEGQANQGGGINNAGKLTVANCTFQNDSATDIGNTGHGSSGGAIYDAKGATLSMTGSTITQCQARAGGGIYVAGGKVTINGLLFQGDRAFQYGGGLFNVGGTVKITETHFQDDRAGHYGAAISNAGGVLDATSCAFSSNFGSFHMSGSRGPYGGAVAMTSGTVAIVGSRFVKNTAGSGGAVYVQSGKLTLAGCALTGNTANYSGGALDNMSGNVALSGCSIANNSAQSIGGAVANTSGTLAIVATKFTKNTANRLGGAVINGELLTVRDSGFTSNSAGTSGGAIWDANFRRGTVLISGSTFESNSAGSAGGGMLVSSGQLTLVNSTVALNKAPAGSGIDVTSAIVLSKAPNGSGIEVTTNLLDPAPELTAINDTIAANVASAGGTGGGLYLDGTSALLDNTIIAKNTIGTGPSATASDVVVDEGGSATGSYNLIGTGGSGGLIDGQDGNQVGVANPGLGSLAANGGPTQTIALLAGSPAIDAGSNAISGVTVPTADQRGALRGPVGLNAGPRVDIGAYEASSSYLVTTTGDGFAPGTLRSAVGWANVSSNANPANLVSPAPNTIVFDIKGVFRTPQTITLNPFLGALEFSGTDVPVAVDGPAATTVAVSGGGRVGVFEVDQGVTATLTSLTITDGSSGLGGGISNAGGLLIENIVLSNNVANGGGAISNLGDLTLIGSTLVDNATNLDFGGAVSNNGTMSVIDSTLSGNSAAEGGGAILTNGPLYLTNVTIAGNSAATIGGGILQTDGPLTAVNVTITGNVAGIAGRGGGLEVDGGTAALYNTIVAQNTRGRSLNPSASDIDVTSPGTLSGSFNLIGTGGSGGLVDGVDNNHVGLANPVLGALGRFGGPAPTIPVLPGSPAIGAGSSSVPGIVVPSTDERGVPRQPGRVDAGAFQDQGFILTVAPGSSPQTTAPGTAFANPMAVIVSSPAGDPVGGGWVTFTAPASGPSAVLARSSIQIPANGRAAVAAVANAVAGSYAVTAMSMGAAGPGIFHLANQSQAFITSVTVRWGSAGSDALVIPGPAGGTLLPAGRTTDLPWLGTSKLIIKLSGPAAITRANVTIISAGGYNYGPIAVAGSGATYSITLGRPIRQADHVTVSINAPGISPFAGTLPVLPGDFNDNGRVDYSDETGVLDEILGITKRTIFGDINGDGGVNLADYHYVVAAQGAKLPPIERNGIPFLVIGTAERDSVSRTGQGAGIAALAPAGDNNPSSVRQSYLSRAMGRLL